MLRAYHNPQEVDESRVPFGWRFLYADEMLNEGAIGVSCRMWLDERGCFGTSYGWHGTALSATYIVPVHFGSKLR